MAFVREIFSVSGFNRAIVFATGGAFGYAFCNPDSDTVYDVFPRHKRPPYAYVNGFKIKEGENHTFEQQWKELARFHQQQEGYLFTKLHKTTGEDSLLGKPKFDFIEVTQWTTGDAYQRARRRPGYQELIDSLPLENKYDPLMYSVVVDDTIVQEEAPHIAVGVSGAGAPIPMGGTVQPSGAYSAGPGQSPMQGRNVR
eukprot:gnl/MRDRNA2_/MRDRNA2_35538_c0_seq1.p1 gnl/MRDRNA2_/MRDRNA2_35538_c0~~gnl/MRDRNA2_/MRDRNA2_35538_c0_seq1.p1  ORF type:complete len:198 (-),score=35.73 gnl/MRDRNA2_/MRDRNA2_35538_c0_seq1:18-611(-)